MKRDLTVTVTVIRLTRQLMLTAIAASGMLSFSIALNAVSAHGTCTVVFVIVGAIISFLISCIQTLDKISWIGWIGVVSIVSSVITLAAATGVSDRPSAAPQTGPFEVVTKAAGHPGFVDGINAVSIIVFAYAGTPNFFNIVGEMRDVKNYTKSVIVCQTFVTMVYLVSSPPPLLRRLTDSSCRSSGRLCITLQDSISPVQLSAPRAS